MGLLSACSSRPIGGMCRESFSEPEWEGPCLQLVAQTGGPVSVLVYLPIAPVSGGLRCKQPVSRPAPIGHQLPEPWAQTEPVARLAAEHSLWNPW